MHGFRWGLLGALVLTLQPGGTPAKGFALPEMGSPVLRQPVVDANTVHHTPHAVDKVKQVTVRGCPRMVAEELHIVRVDPDASASGGQAYRFILDGKIKNKGLAGQAAGGLNVVRRQNGRVVRRVALKLFKQQVRPNQQFDIARDLHVTIRSQAIRRADVAHTRFDLNVLNSRNDSGRCDDPNPTTKTVSASRLVQALPAEPKGVVQRADTLRGKEGKPAGHGFASIGSSANKHGPSAKPLAGPGGKPLLSPGMTGGPKHALHGGHPRVGGFAPPPDAGAGIRTAPVGRPGGGALIQGNVQLELLQVKREDTREPLVLTNNRTVISMPGGTPVKLFFAVRNHGRSPVSVDIAEGPAVSRHVLTVPPGETRPAAWRTTLDRASPHILDAREGLLQEVRVRLVTGHGAVEDFRDANPRDNAVSVLFKVGAPEHLHLKNEFPVVTLKSRGLGGISKGEVNREVSSDVTVKLVIENQGGYPSLPTRLDVSLNDIGAAVAQDTPGRVHRLRTVGAGGETRRETASIPRIAPGESYVATVVFHNVSFQVQEFVRRIRERTGLVTHQITKVRYLGASGHFACGFPPSDDHSGHHEGWQGSKFKVAASFIGQRDQTQYTGQFDISNGFAFSNVGCSARPL